MKYVYICDPSLLASSGHHLDLSLAYQRSLTRFGFKIINLVSSQLAAESDLGLANVRRVFIYNLYGRGFGHSEICNIITKDAISLSREIALCDHVTSRIYLLFHTVTIDILFIIKHFMAINSASVVDRIHLCTPYSDDMAHSFLGANHSMTSAIEALRNPPAAKEKLHIYAENPALSYQLSAKLGMRIPTMWIPAPAFSCSEAYTTKSNHIIIGFTGGAREEKGFHHLPDIISTLQKRLRDSIYQHSHHLSFIVHFNRPLNGLSHKCLDALECLKDFEYVQVYEKILEAIDYQRLIGSFDILLCPYDISRYATRGSGVTQICIRESVAICAPRFSSLYYSTPFVRDYFYDNITEIPSRVIDRLYSFSGLKSRLLAQSRLIAESYHYIN